MALITCSDCQKQISNRATMCPACGCPVTATSKLPASDKERFDLGISMMKGYYDAIETRLAGTLTLFVVIIGWLISSPAAREALADRIWFFALALVTLTLTIGMYVWNICHWLERWLKIRDNTDLLRYMEVSSYTRYQDIPRGTFVAYLAPIVLLGIFIVALIVAIHYGWFVDDHRNNEKILLIRGRWV